MTQQEIYEKCRKYKIGSKVTILERVPRGNGYETVDTKTSAVVIERYPFHLIAERENGVQDSFTYADIVLFNALRIKQGRPKKVS